MRIITMVNWNKIKKEVLFFVTLFVFQSALSQVGVGTVTPDNSSILDVYATNKGFLPPRITTSQRDAIVSPATGLIVFCSDCDTGKGCLVINLGTPAIPNWNCVGASSASVSIDCLASTFSGDFYIGIVVSGTKVRFSVTNNSFVALSALDFSSAVALSGAGSSGLSIASGQNTNVSIPSGGTVLLDYNITGTPSSGSISATFSRLGLNCTKTTASQLQPPVINCSGIVVSLSTVGPLRNIAYTGTVTVPYTVLANGTNYTSEILTSNGLVLTRTAGSYTAPSGNVVYTISGTYTGSNVFETFNLTFGSQSCNGVRVGGLITCKDLVGTGQPSGVYYIDPDGVGSDAPYQCYCDNTTDGGGWTLIAVRNTNVAPYSSPVNPLLMSATGGTLGNVLATNTAFNFTKIRFTNDLNENAIATFPSSQTLNQLNTTYSTYTATPLTVTVTGTDSRLTAFYWRAQSGANTPFIDASDWAYMCFAGNPISGLGDAWDTSYPHWIFSGQDYTTDPFMITNATGKVLTTASGATSHWSAQGSTLTAKSYIWLK